MTAPAIPPMMAPAHPPPSPTPKSAPPMAVVTSEIWLGFSGRGAAGEVFCTVVFIPAIIPHPPPKVKFFFGKNLGGGSGNFRRRAAALIIRPMLQSLTTFPRAARTDAPPPIDFAFPEDEADALARMEAFNKHLFRPNTYLHKWWARRCGTTFRRILKALADDPAGRDKKN